MQMMETIMVMKTEMLTTEMEMVPAMVTSMK